MLETRRLQAQIIDDFDALLAQLQQQGRSGGQQQSTSQSRPSEIDKQQSQDASQANSDRPATRSSNRLGQTQPAVATSDQRDRLLEKAWGDLPASVRQQMQSARPEKFLPKYSRVIEDYFRRLAEQADN